MRVGRVVGAVLGSVALTFGLSVVAGATDAPYHNYQPSSGYQFTSTDKNGTGWQVSNSPISAAEADQYTGSGGVTMQIEAAQGATVASGIIVPVGSVYNLFDSNGTFTGIPVTGNGPYTVDLYIDTNADGHYLAFSNDGYYESDAGDQVLSNVTANPPTLSDVSEGPHGSKALVWAWIGVRGTTAETATVSVANGVNLTRDVLNPSKLVIGNVCRVRGQSTNLWTVHNVAGGRDRSFHLGVTYNGKTTWTGSHTVNANSTVGVTTPYGGTATIQYYDGSGSSTYQTGYATSNSSIYCA
jgi:hypothetical protein